MKSAEKPTYEAIFEACEEGILVVSNQGNILLANRAAQHLFGYNLQEFIKITVEDLVPVKHKGQHINHRQHYNQRPAPRKMGVGRDLMALRKSGEQFPVEISLNTAILNGQQCTVAFIIDISERKKIEDALMKSEEQLIVYATQLENKVSERTKELDRTIKKLEEQIIERQKAEEETKKALVKERELNELKSRVVSMASHEFRTPLSTILSSASLISKYNAPETEDKRIKHVERIKTAIGNLNNILNDFLSLAKLEEGKTEIKLSNISPISICKEVISHLDTVKKSGQRIVFEHHELPQLLSDERIFKNILINLLSNAIKYSGECTTIFLKLRADNSEVVLSIEDEGIGIPPGDQQHLFERFFRAKNVTNIQGTGLGLNIVRKYVEMLHGDITFESKENDGTTFTVTLPK